MTVEKKDLLKNVATISDRFLSMLPPLPQRHLWTVSQRLTGHSLSQQMFQRPISVEEKVHERAGLVLHRPPLWHPESACRPHPVCPWDGS